MTLDEIRQVIGAQGLAYRGALYPDHADLPVEIHTLVLVGFTGRENWASFVLSPEATDGKPDPLDRWSRRTIGAIATTFGATTIFPFDGPPWPPFQRWAQQSEPVYPSPLGILIHPDWGLWHSWRGALALRERLALPEPDRRANPCESCADKPCLTACPAGAFTSSGYAVAACVTHLDGPRGSDCVDQGCRARRACPVGAAHRYTPDQTRFHMQAFHKAQRRSCDPVSSSSR